MLIKEENIQKLLKKAGKDTNKKANDILKNDNIVIEKFQLGWNYEYIYVYARVIERRTYRSVNVNFTIDISNKDIDTYHCQCNYYSSHICAHTLACILEFCQDDRYEKQTIEAIKRLKKEEEQEQFNNFINNFEGSEEETSIEDNNETVYIPNQSVKIIPDKFST